MHTEDALLYITETLRTSNPSEYSQYGYELYIPRVIYSYLHAQDSNVSWGDQKMLDASPIFLNASWELCRRGILRPGVTRMNVQATDEGNAGFGYSVTPFGRQWLNEPEHDTYVPTEPERFAQLLEPFKDKFGIGFHQRAQEAVRCYGAHAYLACCAMCGAAAESIFLAVAIEKSGDSEGILKQYLAAKGRSRIENMIIGKAQEHIKREFEGLTALLKYWRDASAHGTASDVSDNEAYTSIALLLRYAVFAQGNWSELTKTDG